MVQSKGLLKILLLIFLCVSAGSCVRARSPNLPYSNQQKSNLTAGMVTNTLRSGKLRQTDLITVFGAPNIITRDKDGNEVWTDDRQSIASASEVAEWNAAGSIGAAAAGLAGDTIVGGGATVGGSSGKSSTAGQVSSATFTLMIKFDENDLVKDYRTMATQF